MHAWPPARGPRQRDVLDARQCFAARQDCCQTKSAIGADVRVREASSRGPPCMRAHVSRQKGVCAGAVAMTHLSVCSCGRLGRTATSARMPAGPMGLERRLQMRRAVDQPRSPRADARASEPRAGRARRRSWGGQGRGSVHDLAERSADWQDRRKRCDADRADGVALKAGCVVWQDARQTASRLRVSVPHAMPRPRDAHARAAYSRISKDGPREAASAEASASPKSHDGILPGDHAQAAKAR